MNSPLAPQVTAVEIAVAAAVVAVLVLLAVLTTFLRSRRRTTRASAAERERSGPRGPRVDVVLNPTKVSEDNRRELDRALRAAGAAEVRLVETTEQETGRAQARAAADDGADVVAVYGGDGTVMACVTALAETGVPLAIIPAGTGNLLARNLGIPLQTGRAARVAVRGARQRIDVGAVGDERFAVMAGMGFDAAMLRDAPEKVKSRIGPLAYLASAARNLRESGFLCTVTMDEQTPLRRRARTVLVGNVGRLQGGLPVLPGARPDDGLLDVVVISPRTVVEDVHVLWRFAVRRPYSPHMENLVGRRVVIEAVEPQPVQLDGDVRPETDRMVCEVRAGALLVCVPGPQAPADEDEPDPDDKPEDGPPEDGQPEDGQPGDDKPEDDKPED